MLEDDNEQYEMRTIMELSKNMTLIGHIAHEENVACLQ